MPPPAGKAPLLRVAQPKLREPVVLEIDPAASVMDPKTREADVTSPVTPGSYTHLRAHVTKANPVCPLLLVKKNK